MDFFKYGPLKAIIALISIVTLLPSVFSEADESINSNIKLQNEHMEYLQNEFYQSYIPSDENTFTSFDLNEALSDGIKFNQVSFIGTHNSYQLNSTESYGKLYDNLEKLTFGIVDSTKTDFCSDFVTEQLELGIRSIEIDIETVVKDGEVSFVVSHSPFTDMTSNCYDLKKALEEIKMWSDENPGHLPVTIIIEPKKDILPINGFRNFSLSYANSFDETLREVLGDTLLTPGDMLRNHSSFKEMRENDDWMTLSETSGKVMVLLHDTTVSSAYINQDASIKTQAMFPMVRYINRDKSYASFILENDPSDALKHSDELIKELKLIVRTRADSYTSFSDKQYSEAIQSGAQIISTDYPVRKNPSENHSFTFDGGYTVTK